MKNAKKIAEQATIQSFLNCYLRETENFEVLNEDHPPPEMKNSEKILQVPLKRLKINVIIPVHYWSLTGRHLFDFPMYYQVGTHTEWQNLDYVTMTTFIVKELLSERSQAHAEDELLLRVVLSCKKIKDYVEQHKNDGDKFIQEDFDFIHAEQSLLFGHLLHPTPKSKQGLTDVEDQKYSPEYQKAFQLHYFSAAPSLVDQDSSLVVSAADIILDHLEVFLDGPLREEQEAGRLFLPVHPLQVPHLLDKAEVQELLSSGALRYIGPLGNSFTATSSFRTLYNPDSKYMYKFSVPVKVTNSLRVNKPKELDRGVEVSRLLASDLGKDLANNHPNFRIINDPAYINIPLKEEVSGFEVVIRENPFYKDSKHTSAIAALVQDHAYGGKSRLHSIIQGIAKREGRSVERVSLDWFERYLSISLEPVLWLFDNYGIALEAHQQNSLVRLKEGYPTESYYRDNQGYYFSESFRAKLVTFLPTLNEKSDTVCADEVAEERLRYYFFYNHLFGLINGFGTSGLIKEEKLLELVRERLKAYKDSPLLTSLLKNEKLPCKANLLTRLYDMDELVGPMESQSVYTDIQNPLAEKEWSIHGA